MRPHDLEQLIPEELIVTVTRIATSRAITIGLTGDQLNDYVGDALLALCMLADEWDPARDVPLAAWVISRLDHRINDIHRIRTRGLRSGRHLRIAAYDPHGPIFESIDPLTVEDVTTVFVETAAVNDRERFILRALAEGQYHREIADALQISKTRVRQLIDRIGERLTP